ILAPSYTQEALDILAAKKYLRVLETGKVFVTKSSRMLSKNIHGGILSQSYDKVGFDINYCKVVTDIATTETECSELMFSC
ncbi:bifunctional phosphoribosylaminoimidazolecarboxamide formyltransferase/IMP cyclohydrolase, partial [Francisella tularensis subsp. holarctica]|nr:bifunctional phosphoribosylaminoimidazolecarboxamide formyltransferase/IMP cyclohydrolase [Francisella tularensis subsp. holarctica]